MLHIILCILKIIGILLLALILLLLLILLSVLFVPLRYRLQVVQIPEKGQGEASVTWLLHCIRVSFSYDLQQRKTERKLFLFGRRIGEKREKRQKEPEQQQAGQRPQPKPEPERKSEPGQEPEGEPQQAPEPRQEPEPEPQQAPEPEIKQKPKQAPEPESRPRPGFFENLVYNVRQFCDTMKKIPGRIRRILSKPQAAWEKLMGYRQLLEDYQLWDTAGEVKDKLFWLLHHYRVRKGVGYFKFGTGDPASTAELAGFLYILLPASCGQISVEPQFTDSMLQMELTVSGHIRICHLVSAFWWGYRNKKLRRIIKAVMDR